MKKRKQELDSTPIVIVSTMSSSPSPPASPFTKDDRDRAVKGIEKMFVISLLQKKIEERGPEYFGFFSLTFITCVSAQMCQMSQKQISLLKNIYYRKFRSTYKEKTFMSNKKTDLRKCCIDHCLFLLHAISIVVEQFNSCLL